jgi:spermidine/putrescine transport system substrate-binding protein
MNTTLLVKILLAGLLAIATVGQAEPLAKTLHLFNWDNYINPQVLKDFEKEFGVRVVEDKFASNEELLAKLQVGGAGYDVAVPSDYTVRILIRRGQVAKLDTRNLPNLKNIAPRFQRATYDEKREYSVPYLWGTSGIGYSQKALSMSGVPSSWDDLFNPDKLRRHKGRISMLNDMREAIGAALIYKGYSPNSTRPDELEAAKQVLLAQKPYLAKYDSEAYKESLAAGETVLAHGWSGELFAVQATNADVHYVVPKEGSFLFVDNLVVPASSKQKYTAEVFINYLLRADVAAKNSSFLRFPTPNAAAKALIDPKLPGASYDVPANIKFHSIEDIGEAGKLYEKIWTEVKAR